jgi:hypothetical protein
MKWEIDKAIRVVTPDEVIDVLLTMDMIDSVTVATQTTERAKELAGKIYAKIKARGFIEKIGVFSVREGEKAVEVKMKDGDMRSSLVLVDNMEANIRKNEKEAMVELARELRG